MCVCVYVCVRVCFRVCSRYEGGRQGKMDHMLSTDTHTYTHTQTHSPFSLHITHTSHTSTDALAYEPFGAGSQSALPPAASAPPSALCCMHSHHRHLHPLMLPLCRCWPRRTWWWWLLWLSWSARSVAWPMQAAHPVGVSTSGKQWKGRGGRCRSACGKH